MNDKTKMNVKKGKHHHARWFSPQIFAYEEDERNQFPCKSTISLPYTSLNPNYGYSFMFFLLNSAILETNKT